MIWFDLDNSPHVPLFRPVFNELHKMGKEYLITARDFAQTKNLLDLFSLPYALLGKHAGKSKIKKITNLFERANELRNYIKNKGITSAVSHGSRTQLLASKTLGLKTLLMFDYEYTESSIFNYLSDFLICPKFIPDTRLKSAGFKMKKIVRYSGFKEELYLSQFKNDQDFRKILGVSDDEILVVVRPPSMVGNYHDARSEGLLIKIINHFLQNDSVKILLVNRTEVEKKYLQSKLKFSEQLSFLEQAVDGLQLLYAADYTISGGGTMNRESALLGTTTYSIFTGKRPYLDEYLQDLGRLKFIENEREINSIPIQRNINKKILLHSDQIVSEVTDLILNLGEMKPSINFGSVNSI